MAGVAPLYGTCTSCNPAMLFNSSPDKCEEVPRPPDPKFNVPGVALAYAMNCWTDWTGSDGCTTKIFGERDNSEIGVKSFCGSYGRFEYTAALIPCEAVWARISV